MFSLVEMSFKHSRFPLSLEELQKLSESESGIVLRKDCTCHLKLSYSVLPVNSKAFKAAIHEELNKRVLKYNAEYVILFEFIIIAALYLYIIFIHFTD